jgi:predicted RND superfamily exporter protein
MLALENSVLSDQNNPGRSLITGSWSLADVVSSAAGQIPENADIVATIIDNLDPAVKGRFLSDNQAVVYFYVNAKTDKESEQATKIVRTNVEAHSDGALDLKIDGEPAVGGEPVVISDIVESITPTVFNSTFLTILLCFIVLVILFRSPVTGFIVLLPLLLTLGWEFGTLRLLGWSLDVLTMGISALIIGLGVDYAVHVTHRFKEERARKSPEEAVRATVMSIGTAMLAAAATTVGVFAVLSLSGMPAMGRFGSLTALVILYGLAAALIILPSVLVVRALWKKK